MSKSTSTSQAAATENLVTQYPPLTPQEAATELGVPLTQRLLPDLSAAVPKRFVTLEEAKARGWSWYFDGTTGACRYGHQAARRVANKQICADCERIKDSKEPIYAKSKTQKFYAEPRRKPKDASAPVVIAAPAAAPAQVEPTRKEQDFLASLDETRDFDAAAERANYSRSQIEARASVNEVFRKALTDLCERRGIAWTRAPDSEFKWSAGVKRHLKAVYVNSGLLREAWDAVGVSASEYYAHLEADSDFAADIDAAQPLAAETLRQRSLQAASAGNDKLLKILDDQAAELRKNGGDKYANMSVEQMSAEITRILADLDRKGVLTSHGPEYYWHRQTGERIDLRDYTCNERTAQPDNNDLVGGE
jgi:hypothetical protein